MEILKKTIFIAFKHPQRTEPRSHLIYTLLTHYIKYSEQQPRMLIFEIRLLQVYVGLTAQLASFTRPTRLLSVIVKREINLNVNRQTLSCK